MARSDVQRIPIVRPEPPAMHLENPASPGPQATWHESRHWGDIFQAGYFTRVTIVVRYVKAVSAHLAQQLSIAIQSRAETRFEHSFRLGCRCFEL